MKINPIGHLVKTNPKRTQTNPILSAVGGLQMNVNSLIAKDYRKKDDFAVRKNKANSNPILSAVGGFQMNVNLYVIKEYENVPRLPAPGKRTQFKPNQSRSEFIPKGAQIPTGELLGILKPGTNFKRPLQKKLVFQALVFYKM